MTMRRTMIALAFACAGGVSPLASANPPADVMQVVREADIKWMPTRFGTPFAVLAGNVSQPGPYEVRVRFPPGVMSPPHFHAETRYILVLKGTWWVGSGPTGDPRDTIPLPAGTFVVHHPNQVHYDGAKDEEVELQIIGVGPSSTTTVDKAGKPGN